MGRPSIVTSGPAEASEHQLMAGLFRTLGNPWRLRILEVLVDLESATQADIIAQLGLSHSRASVHLHTLMWSGLIAAEDDGDTVHYRVRGNHPRQFLQRIREFSAARPRDEESEPTVDVSDEGD